MTVTMISGRRGIQVTVVLGRRLLSNILTVFLPTLLLNIIGHTTVYFRPYSFEVNPNTIDYIYSCNINTFKQ